MVDTEGLTAERGPASIVIIELSAMGSFGQNGAKDRDRLVTGFAVRLQFCMNRP
jgi:hypothetical protein